MARLFSARGFPGFAFAGLSAEASAKAGAPSSRFLPACRQAGEGGSVDVLFRRSVDRDGEKKDPPLSAAADKDGAPGKPCAAADRIPGGRLPAQRDGEQDRNQRFDAGQHEPPPIRFYAGVDAANDGHESCDHIGVPYIRDWQPMVKFDGKHCHLRGDAQDRDKMREFSSSCHPMSISQSITD
jgi:hypothetical protein